MRFAVREPALVPAFPRGHRPPDGAVADRVHLAAYGTGGALLPAGEARLGAFTERLLVQHVRPARPRLRRRLRLAISRRAQATTIDIPGRERRLLTGGAAGVLAPRGR